MAFVSKRATGNRRSETIVVASGFGSFAEEMSATADVPLVDQLVGFVYQKTSTPGWAKPDVPYKDVSNELLVIVRRGALVAVHGDASLRQAILRWIDSDSPPPFRRVSAAILQGAFLRGAARGLWLHGVHPHRATKADSKNISGPRLQDALSPFEDSTFALGSARANVPDDPNLQALGGAVGTTPRDALVWNRSTRGFDEFLAIVNEILGLVEETTNANAGVDRPYPLLAAEVGDLDTVHNAYELSVLGPEELPPGPDTSDEVVEAAELLERAVLNVAGDAASPHFRIDVGLNGAIGGRLRCNVTRVRGRIRLNIGFDGQPSDDASTRAIRSALFFDQLLTVHYLSGHALYNGALYLPEIRDMPFPGWEFADFAGFDITKEKPAKAHSDIHRDVGGPSDDSLFGWVVKQHAGGWLTCDDGAGEIADFVHLAVDGKLTLIHVKGANTDSVSRQVAATPYELVVGQASKNIGFLQHSHLAARLAQGGGDRATWNAGVREPDRQGFLAALSARSPTAALEIVIVQPHLTKRRYDLLHGNAASAPLEDLARLRRLETLLNAARGAITVVGADLRVIGGMA